MKLLWGFKTVDDLKTQHTNWSVRPMQKEKRGLVKIGVIDDKKFEPLGNLKTYGYDIVEIGDPNVVEEVARYPIVLCDLMGVGVKFGQHAEGAGIIKEIRKNYPATFVVAYTGAAAGSEVAIRAKHYADRLIRKDADLDTWTDELDRLLAKATDPAKIWLRTRVALAEESVNSKDILLMEDAFVRSVIDKDKNAKKLSDLLNSGKLEGVAVNIGKGVVASYIFSLLAAL